MAKEQINLTKQSFNKRDYTKVIDTSFTQLVNQVTSSVSSTPSISIEQFFQNYNDLFYVIPKVGDINSHEYLIKTSTEYTGYQAQNNDITALIDEVTFLRQQNLDLNKQLLSTQISSSV